MNENHQAGSSERDRHCAGERIDLAAIREKLNGASGARYWRSLDELADTKDFQDLLHREFPSGASEWWDGLSRRNFLRVAAASLALSGLTACTRQPTHQILPYVNQPEDLVPGEPLFYATAMVHNGFAQGVLVKNREGHPVKIEGNPEHPMVQGASDIWMQASILDLYDPDRSQSVAHRSEASTWSLFLSALNEIVDEQQKKKGAGLRILTETITSPSLAAQLRAVLALFPEAKWHQYEPITRDGEREGARMAFGEIVATHYQFEKASIVVSLDSDFLYTHPARLRYTRDFTNGRRLSGGRGQMNRLYVAESSPTITGTMAEERLPVASSEIGVLLRALIAECGASASADSKASLTQSQSKWVAKAAFDLREHRGSSLVVAGEWQPAEVHALVHALNQMLRNIGSTVVYTEPAETQPVNQMQSLAELARAMHAQQVDALIILGGNPVYNAPVDLDFASALAKVKWSIHLSTQVDETSALSTWHVPQAHYLEAWGDARAFDGTISLQQPLIAPLYGGKTAYELLDILRRQQPFHTDYDCVRAFWQTQNLGPDFEKGWRKALHDGFIAESQCKPKQVSVPEKVLAELSTANPPGKSSGLELNLRPDPSLGDGRFSNNGWLQECPRPISKLTWDNALLVSPALAQREHLQSGEVVEARLQERSLRAPVLISPGQAENSVTLHLGYGRSGLGRVAEGVGVNAYELRTAVHPWIVSGLTLKKTGLRHQLVATQTHHNLEGEDRQIYRAGNLKEFLANPDFLKTTVSEPPKSQTLYYPEEFRYDGYKWGMSIDLTTCIGCNACVVACEVENNIPVVGKEQVSRNREMLWLRLDTYYEGPLDNPRFNHMPVPCMQCEHAPCELVCPVAATVHDHEGLNVQVYNRCVGTRFCSNNCPYKVRRFNFLQYTKYHEPSLKPMFNPDVTVRWRGVMEKCTYCVQRISRARITGEKENRRIRDGEVTTACQQACPADAIVFGDMNDPESRLAKLKQRSLDYSMLGQLNTRPRTTYLAKIRNPA